MIEMKEMKIHAQFTWSQSGQAIRISNQFVTDGKARPYLEDFTRGTPSNARSSFGTWVRKVA